MVLDKNFENALKNHLVKKILPRYIKVVRNKNCANFQIAKRIVVDFENNMNDKQLWQLHDKLMEKFYEIRFFMDSGMLSMKDLELPRFSLLDLKILLAEEMMKSCELCERKCEINRLEGEKGECKVGKNCLISSEFMHGGEEAYVSPSHTIFFMGCNFHCQFCQNYTISQWYESGYPVQSEWLAGRIDKMREEGCRNMNFVGGEPTPSMLPILKTLKLCKSNAPVVWNSNFYMSEKTMKILDGIVDMHLSDFKYGNSECASHFSKVPNYFEICSRNHLLATRQTEITVRHLVLPDHVECCSKPILDWIAKNIRRNCIVNLMDQYAPQYRADQYTDINRKISEDEFNAVVKYAKKLKINYMV